MMNSPSTCSDEPEPLSLPQSVEILWEGMAHCTDGHIGEVQSMSLPTPGTYYPETEHGKLNAILRHTRLRAEVAEARVAELEKQVEAEVAMYRALEFRLTAAGYREEAAEARLEAMKARRGPWFKRMIKLCPNISVSTPLDDFGSADFSVGVGLCFQSPWSH
jgi:hypothetical protein